ncbi:MAG: trypsin-like peptidase domain-containing protein [Acidobacteriales bacterium]|nr:trypsin-like peptidase domain-containing protein [Terriglobales bacterium]
MLLITNLSFPQGGAGVAPSGKPYRLIRAVSGSKYVEDAGRFHITDPRSTFYLPDDKKLIVYMEWEGPPGKHSFEGYWRNPSGKVMAVGDFQYELKPNERAYGGYLELLLSDSAPTGLWTLEARIDGESLTNYTFEVISAVKPAINEDTRLRLSLNELFVLANGATVTIERLDGDGRVLNQGAGFFIENGTLITAFQNVDGATSLRGVFPSGQTFSVDGFLAWNRSQDWAALRVSSANPPKLLKLAPNSELKVGDRGFTINFDESGGKIIADATINGELEVPNVGKRLKIASSVNRRSLGGPVVNEYGEVFALTAGIRFPGLLTTSTNNDHLYSTIPSNLFSRGARFLDTDTALPLTQVSFSNKAPVPLTQMIETGQILSPVTGRAQIIRGTLARSLDRKVTPPLPQGEDFEYSRSTPTIVTFIVWNPVEKIKAPLDFRLVDSSNRTVGASKPIRISAKQGETQYSTWEISPQPLAPGLYRVEANLGSALIWRSFFRITN